MDPSPLQCCGLTIDIKLLLKCSCDAYLAVLAKQKWDRWISTFSPPSSHFSPMAKLLRGQNLSTFVWRAFNVSNQESIQKNTRQPTGQLWMLCWIWDFMQLSWIVTPPRSRDWYPQQLDYKNDATRPCWTSVGFLDFRCRKSRKAETWHQDVLEHDISMFVQNKFVLQSPLRSQDCTQNSRVTQVLLSKSQLSQTSQGVEQWKPQQCDMAHDILELDLIQSFETLRVNLNSWTKSQSIEVFVLSKSRNEPSLAAVNRKNKTHQWNWY